jgi:hypothetical protein
MKKLYAALLPLVAIVAFVAVPAAAQAQPTWEACKAKTGGKFTTNTCATEGTPKSFEWEKVGNLSEAVLTDTKNVTGKSALLENEAKTAGISCEVVKDESWVWNRAGRGRDINEVEFTKCKGVGGLATCAVTEPIVVEAYTRLELEGTKIYNKFSSVDGEPFTSITLANKGAEVCPAGNPVTAPVTGSARGEAIEHSNKQKFNGGEYTLEFLGAKSEFTGEIEAELSPSKGGVRVS